MSTIKARKKVKKTDGTYDAVHYETEASLVLTEDGSNVEAHIKDIGTNKSDKTHTHDPASVGGIPVVKTYTPAGGRDGVDYAADVPGLTDLYNGLRLTIEIHVDFDTIEQPTVSINGLPAKPLKRLTSLGTISEIDPFDFIFYQPQDTLCLRYLKNHGIWTIEDARRPSVGDLDGLMGVAGGGTGLARVPVDNYLVGDDVNNMKTKTPEQVREHIGAAPVGGTPAVITFTPSGGTDGEDYAVNVPGLVLSPGVELAVKFHKINTGNGFEFLYVNSNDANTGEGHNIKGIDTLGRIRELPHGALRTSDNAYVRIRYDGLNWLVMDSMLTTPEYGGTGLTTVGKDCYLVGDSATSMKSKTPTEVRKHIGAASASKSFSAILGAAIWSGTGPYTQSIAVTGVSITPDTNGIIGLEQKATAEQRAVARDAMLSITSQSAYALTITADGEKPTLDIPVTVTIID